MTEVVLQEIVFSNNKALTLSLAIEKHRARNILRWVVASEGRSANPVAFFGDSERAIEEFKKRCGEGALSGLTVQSNEIYGSLRGYYICEKPPEPIKIKKDGYKIVQKSVIEAAAWKEEVNREKTLKLTGV